VGLGSWIKKLNPFGKDVDTLESIITSLVSREIYKRMAVDACINLIANAFVRCEFKTLENGKSVKKDNYYLFNVAPNKNQSADEFKKKIVNHLIRKNDCLIVMVNNQLFIADDYNVESFVLKESVYSQVTVDDYQFRRSFEESDVIHLKLNDENVMKLISSFYKDYGKLVSAAQDIYKRSNAKRFILKGEFIRSQNDGVQKKINDMLQGQFDPWLNADNAGSIFQLPQEFTLEDASGNGKAGVTQQTTRDARALIDDVFDFVATSLHVPIGLLKGNVVEVSNQTDNFLMFAVNPLVHVVDTGINKSMYRKEDYLKGTRLKIDSSNLKIIDINDLAVAVDKFFATGAMSINDVIEKIGGERIDESWANKHYVTKNYQDASQNPPLEGGDN